MRLPVRARWWQNGWRYGMRHASDDYLRTRCGQTVGPDWEISLPKTVGELAVELGMGLSCRRCFREVWAKGEAA